MTNSTLVSYTKLSPNYSKRTKKIKKITIHHAAGVISVEGLGEIFANPERKASANYGIDSDGRIALYVNEDHRAWTSSNAANDHQAVTIEVSNDALAPDWTISEKAFNALLDLCYDICVRNDIKELVFTGDATGNVTLHKYFKNTLCPGPYLEHMMPVIVKKVNTRLEGDFYDPYGKKEYENIIGEKSDIPSEKSIWHVIRKGETLSGIARRYGTTVSAIQKLNKNIIRNVNLIYPGIKIRIK